MTELPTGVPPTPVPKKRGPAFWIFACCGGCALLALIPIVLGGAFFLRMSNAYDESQDPVVQTRTYDAAVPNLGPPPGYRIVVGNTVPFFGVSLIIFAPEDVKGEPLEIFESSATIGFLVRSREDASDRAKRDRLFADPKSGEIPEIPFLERDEIQNVKTGTIPGHLFPLRYFTATIREGGRPGRRIGFAMVDLTPEGSEYATLLFLRSPTIDEITYEFLVEFCRNFKPG